MTTPEERSPFADDQTHSAASSASESGTTHGDAAAASAPAAPHRWGEFRIIRELGHGGFGRVYRAFDEGLSKEIALKVVRPRDRSLLSEAMREGQMLARMRHPHIVTVHAVRQSGDEVGFVMELVEGESLAERVKRAGQLGPEEATVIGQTLCHALAAVHGAGLLHRDIKAHNVMREGGGRIVLMDFGAGRDRNSKEPSHELAGTPPYLAPELFHGGSASPASDLYSLGVLLYFLVTGAYPVEGPTPVAIAVAHATGHRKLLVDRRPDLPHDFIRVVERALSTSPAARYQSAGEMLTDLDALSVRGEHHSPVFPAPPRPVPPPAPSRVARWAWGIAGAGVFVVLLGSLSTRAFDAAFSLGRFADDSLGVWAITGLYSLVPPGAFAAMAVVALLIIRTVWQVLAPSVPPLGRVAARVSSWIAKAVDQRIPRDLNAVAQWLLLGQVIVVVILLLLFQSVLSAFITPFENAQPSTWHVLHFQGGDDAQLGRVNYYQMSLPVVAVLMAYAWWRLLRRPDAFAVVDKPILGAGLAIVVVLVVAVAMPWRVFYAAQDAPGYTIDGERCYEVARLPGEARLFCPDMAAGSRSRVVPTSDLRQDRRFSKPTIFERAR